MDIKDQYGKICYIDEKLDLANKYIEENDIIFELGARYGSFSCAINSKLKHKTNQVVVEPDERVWESLERNKKANNCEFHIVKGFVSNDSSSTYILEEFLKKYNLNFNVLVADCEGFLETFLDENPNFCDGLRLIIFDEDHPNKCNYDKIRNILIEKGFSKNLENKNENAGGQNVWLKSYFLNQTNWNQYKLNEQHDFDYRVLTTYEIPNKLIRLGPKSDGGYVIAEGFNYDLFLSCGICDDLRFEDAFLDIYKNVPCFAFDGTIHQCPTHKSNIQWVKKNIGHSSNQETTNLKEYMKKSHDIFLKMDIEGSEFNWIDSMTIDDLNKISQLVIEIHWPFDKYRCRMLDKLASTHYVIHLHGNNGPGMVMIHNTEKNLVPTFIPEVIEITYVNKKLFDSKNVKKVVKNYPIPDLDFGNHPNIYRKQLHFSIPVDNNFIFIGSSLKNTKIIPFRKKEIIGHNLLNKQSPEWKDMFEFQYNNTQLVIKRKDWEYGWGQEMIIPVKRKEILIYNGFNFHFEMFGFILEFCDKNNIDATIVNKVNMVDWFDFYKKLFKFKYLDALPNDLDHYLFVLVLTEYDLSFPDSLINKNVVCINHVLHELLRPLIQYSIPISAYNNSLYAMPIFEYINYDDKMQLLKKNKRPILTFLGNSTLPENTFKMTSIIRNFYDFDVYIINRIIPKFLDYLNLSNVVSFENVSAEKMFELLAHSNYIFHIPNTSPNAISQTSCVITTGSLHLSFTTGCKMVMPKTMNKFLNLQSIITYDDNSSIQLDVNPSLIETFQERERLLLLRDKTLFDLEHMKVFKA